jgi:hypothetical protein
MKTNSIFLGVALLTLPAMAFAQKGIKDGSKYGHGEDSVRCISNLSMMTQYTKQKDYESAAPCFEIVYAECPKCSKNVYINGAEILANQLSKETDAAKKEKIFDRLMKLYDDRTKYFGKDKKFDKYYILGKKAGDYIRFVPDSKNDPNKEVAYNWLGEIIDAKKEATSPTVLQQRFYLSANLYQANRDAFRDKFLSDYLTVSGYIGEKMAALSEDDPDLPNYQSAKADIDQKFASSGAADCKTLDGVYGSKIEANKSDKDFLNMVLSLYALADCEESSTYFKAAAYKHKIDPSANSARGLASQSIKNKDYNKALTYLNDAINLETKNNEKSKLQYIVATIYRDMKNPTAARTAAQKAISFDRTNGKAYMLIGTLYATFNNDISDDAVIRQTAYWVAVEQWEKAKQADPSVSAEANRMINKYKPYFPAADQLFMRNITKGQSFTVPGWINEKTTVK